MSLSARNNATLSYLLDAKSARKDYYTNPYAMVTHQTSAAYLLWIRPRLVSVK